MLQMQGISTDREQLERSVLAMTLDDGHLESMLDWKPLTHSVLNVTLDGRSMEGIPDLEPLEHSVLVMTWTVDSRRGCHIWNRSTIRF